MTLCLTSIPAASASAFCSAGEAAEEVGVVVAVRDGLAGGEAGGGGGLALEELRG